VEAGGLRRETEKYRDVRLQGGYAAIFEDVGGATSQGMWADFRSCER
jgi:hypothetical protein